MLHGVGYTGDKPAAANGHHDLVHIGQLLHTAGEISKSMGWRP